MDKRTALEFLRNNPVFWSRLGFCYDPPIADNDGKPLVFEPDFTRQLKIHDDFSDAGIKIHTCILHTGWVGVNKHDYSLCDRVLEEIFKSGKTQYFIPRIKLNVPVDWCYENPTEVFVYENGPETEEEIKSLVGTLKQDYLGYESPVGYYNAGAWKDTRPNVGGVISLQSFCSEKWLQDAGEALRRLVIHLESSPYADRILGYHIAYGACGESMPWGRQSGRFGDYGINAKKHFLNFGLKKYGSEAALKQAWGNYEKSVVPPSELREKTKNSSADFYKDEVSDRWSIDYDEFTSFVNTNALEHFAKIIKDNTSDKPVGAFYGYLLYMDRSAYAGHLGFEKLLQSPYLDFFAAPKSYFRCGPGEPGGEMTATVTVNRTKLWVDECDNRTHLTKGDSLSNATCPEETYAVQLREFCKNLTHNSGLWYMDLGGGWYDDKGIMSNIASIINLSQSIRREEHKSCARIIVIVDEKSVMLSHPTATEPVEGFLRNLQLCGTPIDIIYSFDIEKADFSNAALAVLLTPLCMTEEKISLLRSRMKKDAHLLFCSYCKEAADISFESTDNTSVPYFNVIENENTIPVIRDGKNKVICVQNSLGDYFASSLTLSVSQLREILRRCGVHFYAPEECAVYADNRLVSFFPKKDMSFTPDLPDGTDMKNLVSHEDFDCQKQYQVKAKGYLVFIKK